MTTITKSHLQSTTWVRQLVGDVDGTKLTSGQGRKPKNQPDIGHYPGGPPIPGVKETLCNDEFLLRLLFIL